MCRYPAKAGTATTTLAAPAATPGVTARKEATNILYAGERWGTTKKGPKSYVAERIFVPDDRVYLGRQEEDGIETLIGHVPSAQGPRSIITRYEYVHQATIRFRLLSMRDCLDFDHWREILTLLQEIGLGSVRSQSFGTFTVGRFGVLRRGEWDDLLQIQGIDPAMRAEVAAIAS